MFEAPRFAVIIALALMTVGAAWVCAQGGPAALHTVPGTGVQEVAVQDALRAVLRQAAVSAAENTETDSIVPVAAVPAGMGGTMMQFIAMPVVAAGALRPVAPAVAAPAARGPPTA